MLENDPTKVEKVLIVKGSKSDKINKVIELCKAKGIRFDLLPAEKVNSLLERHEHTNVLAMISDFRYMELQSAKFSENSKVVVLDNIEDPHNLGAIIRSVAGSGAEAVIIPDRNAAQVTDTVVHVSCTVRSIVRYQYQSIELVIIIINYVALRICNPFQVIEQIILIQSTIFLWIGGTNHSAQLVISIFPCLIK